jgi:antitoxin CptB
VNDEKELRKLRWQCRRGMLELDLALRVFMDQQFASLTSHERATFRRLLDTPDAQLQAWLLNHEEVPDYELRQLIKRI